MTGRTWLIVGATSIIAEQFAHIAALNGNQLRLVGRDKDQLQLIAQDIQLRYQISCEFIVMDMHNLAEQLLTLFNCHTTELDLFIAQSNFCDNEKLDLQSINNLIQINVMTTCILINSYLKLEQKKYHLLYLSSVAAGRGRAKNSLYGGSKAMIEIYLEGLQQAAPFNTQITIARLGFIDTKQTYGIKGIFYAAPPKNCASACWQALQRKKRMIYFPGFWRFIILIINLVPFFIYKKMRSI